VIRARILLISALLTGMTACSGGGVNAGEEGGVAFIGFAVMLIISGIALWLALGRED
jgi:hypothetical protein